MSSRRVLGWLPVTALLGACAGTYQASPSVAQAKVRFTNVERPQICVDKEAHTLVPDADGLTSIPAGRPIHIVTLYHRNTGQCFPSVRFTPQAGKRYQFVNEAKEERCSPTVMVDDSSAPYGVRIEPSASPAPVACKLGPGG